MLILTLRVAVWIRSVLPSTALEAHEEAWNAYPFTKTRYSCPLMDRMSIEVETKYLNDAGMQENVFELSKEELKDRTVGRRMRLSGHITHATLRLHGLCEGACVGPRLLHRRRSKGLQKPENWPRPAVRRLGAGTRQARKASDVRVQVVPSGVPLLGPADQS